MSLLLLFNQPAAGGDEYLGVVPDELGALAEAVDRAIAEKLRTAPETLGAMSELAERAIAEKVRAATEALDALTEVPTRSVGWTRHESRPYE